MLPYQRYKFKIEFFSHGRDAKTGQGHGNQTERERTTWIVTNSDDLNERYYQTPAIVDILPSIATHLRLDIPANIRDQLDGQSFITLEN